MRLIEVKVSNFRAYGQETIVRIDPLTVLVGRNDVGKSSILDALDIFFNDALIERDDCCVHTGSTEITISCVFDELPNELVIDDQYPTTLQAERLLRVDEKLEIKKIYSCTAAKGKLSSVVALANHPSADGINDLLGLRVAELRQRAQDRNVDLANTNQAIKAQLRQAIWDQTAELNPLDQEVSLNNESGKEVWEHLQRHFPVYAVFKSDRASTDQDAEAQDPMRAAIKEAIRTREAELNGVIEDVRAELQRLATRTIEKIGEMSPDLANQLTPRVKNKNWDSLFSVSLTGDDDIPLNKRGSGTRRLVLLNFFRAKAEEVSNASGTQVIYAVEEPETSQHPHNQVMLLDAFTEMVEQGHCQLLITTHTPTLARRISCESLRLISTENGFPSVHYGTDDATLQMITDTLGVLPDHDVKVFFGVEGKHDISFMKGISRVLSGIEADIPNLEAEEQSGRLVFVSLGGSNLDMWVSTLANLNRPEFYLTDRDQQPPLQPKYHREIVAWNARGCTAWVTSKRELENYIHVDAITDEVPTYPGIGAEFEQVPLLFAEAVHSADPAALPWANVSEEKKKSKASAAKRRLNQSCVARMTPGMLAQSDPNDEIRQWLRAVGQALNA